MLVLCLKPSAPVRRDCRLIFERVQTVACFWWVPRWNFFIHHMLFWTIFVSGCCPIVCRCIIFVHVSQIQDHGLFLCLVTCLSIFDRFREPNELLSLLRKNLHLQCNSSAVNCIVQKNWIIISYVQNWLSAKFACCSLKCKETTIKWLHHRSCWWRPANLTALFLSKRWQANPALDEERLGLWSQFKVVCLVVCLIKSWLSLCVKPEISLSHILNYCCDLS